VVCLECAVCGMSRVCCVWCVYLECGVSRVCCVAHVAWRVSHVVCGMSGTWCVESVVCRECVVSRV